MNIQPIIDIINNPFEDYCRLFQLIDSIERMTPVGEVGDIPTEQYTYTVNTWALLSNSAWYGTWTKLEPTISFVGPRWLMELKERRNKCGY